MKVAEAINEDKEGKTVVDLQKIVRVKYSHSACNMKEESKGNRNGTMPDLRMAETTDRI